MEQLNKTDLDIVNKLFNITNSIYGIYKKFEEIEKHGKKGTFEYQKYKGYLLMLLEEEQGIYLDLYNNSNLVDIFNYINERYNERMFSEEYNYFFNLNNYIANRILYRLKDILKITVSDKKRLPRCLTCNITDAFSDECKYNYDTMLLENSLFDDIVKTYMYYFGLLFRNNSKQDVLRKEKYKISFLNRSFENDMFDTDFELQTPDLISKYRAKFTSISYDEFQSLAKYLVIENAISNIMFLQEYKVFDKESENFFMKKVSILASLLRNISEDDVDYVKSYYYESLYNKYDNSLESKYVKNLIKKFPIDKPMMID